MLLQFAKMDYNKLQDLYRREICECMRWWEEYVPKYPYVRNRLVEMYVFALVDYYEPYYSHARMITTKLFMILFVLDDTYDSYGTPMELECFTSQIQRLVSIHAMFT
ncbi:unnamed protein product [Cuscuta campestris]|uniref:Terpene synthase metal-binding domain-containing protein n=1 Tax=Cuscuta campestris TaxID=132261 RepID=A0A484KFM7_9ASTE|nr:unnamed protein product [Cuscuta campestris]